MPLPSSSSQINSLFSISPINWSNLKRIFTGSYHHILPSLCTNTVSTMCPLVRMRELSTANPSTHAPGLIPSLLSTQGHNSSNLLFLLKLISLYLIAPISMQLYHYLSTVQQSKEHALDLRSPSSYYQISLLSVTAKLLERVVSTLECPFLLLSFSLESTATRISPPLLWRNSSGQGHQWRPCWLPQLLTQPKVCHLLPLWDLSLNFLFVK